MVTSFRINPDSQRTALEQLERSSGPSRTYFILTALSTVIASYGLISDSTASVIGAMIVAPLMGPILGLAMGAVREDRDLTKAALAAEAAGVLLCVATAGLVALTVSPAAIDFGNHEISARIHPTLYDMAVGLAAGLAGAYATINERISASIAGVAIAVALVPPLAVCGLCLLGALTYSSALWTPATSAFLLFFVNFLTIEVAAVAVFYLGGFRVNRGRVDVRYILRHFGIVGLLLVAVGMVLSNELSSLLQERSFKSRARQVLNEGMAQIPGATIDRLTVTLVQDKLQVRLIALSPQEVSPAMVRRLQEQVSRAVGMSTQLTVRTVSSVYATAEGHLFEPTVTQTPDPSQMMAESIDRALRAVLRDLPEVELVNFRKVPATPFPQLFVTVRAPYVLGPSRVARLQDNLNVALLRLQPNSPRYELIVRSMLSRDATASEYLEPAPLTPENPGGAQVQAQGATVRQTLERLVATVSGARLLDVEVSAAQPAPDTDSSASPSGAPPSGVTPTTSTPPPAWTPESGAPKGVEIRAVVLSPSALDERVVTHWQGELATALEAPVRLTIDDRIGVEVTAPPVDTPRTSP